MPNTLIVGAGIAGLAAASALSSRGRSVVVLERSRKIGGLATTDEVDGFRFDQTGHFLHLSHPVAADYFHSLGVPLRKSARQAAVLLGGRTIPYPLQYNLWALDPLLRTSVFQSLQAAARGQAHPPQSFEEALLATWGSELMNIFFRPYHEKMLARPLHEVPVDCLGKYAVSFDLSLVAAGLSGATGYPGYNSTFFYPAVGHLAPLTRAMALPFEDKIIREADICKIDPPNRLCHLRNGSTIRYARLISTTPLSQLLKLISMPLVPEPWLDHTSILNIRVGFHGSISVPYQWAYLPDPWTPCFRVGFPTNIAQANAPKGCASISLELGMRNNQAVPGDVRSIATQTLAGLKDAGWLEFKEITLIHAKRISPAYVLYRSENRSVFTQARERLRRLGIHLAGRFGVWDYFSMEDAFLSGLNAADEIPDRTGTDPNETPDLLESIVA